MDRSTDQAPASRAKTNGQENSEAQRIDKGTTVVAHPIGKEPGIPLVDVLRMRGGLSAWSVLSGVLVAFGAFVVLSALVGTVLAASGLVEGGSTSGEARAAGIAALVGLVLVQFLAYFWGGYTAGRMARGSGWMNGLLVAVGALAAIVALGALIGALGASPQDAAAGMPELPLALAEMTELATAAGIALLVSMLGGALLGGRVGARWHTKLENSGLPHVVR